VITGLAGLTILSTSFAPASQFSPVHATYTASGGGSARMVFAYVLRVTTKASGSGTSVVVSASYSFISAVPPFAISRAPVELLIWSRIVGFPTEAGDRKQVLLLLPDGPIGREYLWNTGGPVARAVGVPPAHGLHRLLPTDGTRVRALLRNAGPRNLRFSRQQVLLASTACGLPSR